MSRGPAPSADEQSGRRPAWLIVGGLVVALYVVGLAVTGLGEAVSALARASLPLLLVALALEVATVTALAMVHRASAVAVGHRVRYRDALNVSMTAFTLTQSLPGGGAVAGAVAVQRFTRLGLGAPVAAASVALTATIATSTIAAIGAAGIAVAVARGELAGVVLAVALGVLATLLALVVGVLLVVRSPTAGSRLVRAVGRLHHRLEARVERWQASLRGLAAEPPTLAQVGRIVGWSSLNWGADIAALGLVFVAFGEPVTVMVVLVGFAVSQLAAAIPVTPGGVGFVEAGMVGAFVALGVDLSLATVVVVAYRVLATWLPTLAGVPALLRPP